MVQLLLSKYKSDSEIKRGAKIYALFMKERDSSPFLTGVFDEDQSFWKKTTLHYRCFASEVHGIISLQQTAPPLFL